jgi:hypothetical protein
VRALEPIVVNRPHSGSGSCRRHLEPGPFGDKSADTSRWIQKLPVQSEKLLLHHLDGGGCILCLNNFIPGLRAVGPTSTPLPPRDSTLSPPRLPAV